MLEVLSRYEPLVVFFIFVSDLIGTIYLIKEYYWGRPDMAVKNEARQQKRIRERKEVPLYEKEMD